MIYENELVTVAVMPHNHYDIAPYLEKYLRYWLADSDLA